VQRGVERGRLANNLIWTDSQNKPALETGLLALGGFRGIVADLLWIRAISHQENGRYYELKLLCDLIQKLQPTFVQVHAFQAYNMAYNLAAHAESCEDKWYWIRSGLTALEQGLERTKRYHGLWFELGYHYSHRLSDKALGDCKQLRLRDLPNLDDLTDDQRQTVFLKEEERREEWRRRSFVPHPARYDEHVRFSAYYYWKAIQTGTDPNPLRTEREFGQCLETLGHFGSRKPPGARRNWDDWGAEDWWVELRQRNMERGFPNEPTVPTALLFCMYEQMDFFGKQARQARTDEAANFEKQQADAYARCRKYFPTDQRSLEQMLTDYHEHMARVEKVQRR
jgi:hypothetical protein